MWVAIASCGELGLQCGGGLIVCKLRGQPAVRPATFFPLAVERLQSFVCLWHTQTYAGCSFHGDGFEDCSRRTAFLEIMRFCAKPH